MKITKLGHCCMIVEENGTKIMTDPGTYSTLQNKAKNVDYIFITHEHQDHFHLESLKIVLKNNPKATVVTNSAVGRLLDVEKTPYKLLEQGGVGNFGGIEVGGFGEKHALIYEGLPQVQNTGYFFANRFFYPGDAFFNPQTPVEILALPVAGPWMKISDAIDYAKLLKPKFCFPVHDGNLKSPGVSHSVPAKILSPLGIKFEPLTEGDSRIF